MSTGYGVQRGTKGTHATDVEEQALELLVLGARDLEETSGRVLLRARRLLVLVESVGGEEEERGAGVGDTRGGRENLGVRAVGDGLLDADVVGCRGGSSDRPTQHNPHIHQSTSFAERRSRTEYALEGHLAGVLRRVGAAQVQGTGHVRARRGGREGNA